MSGRTVPLWFGLLAALRLQTGHLQYTPFTLGFTVYIVQRITNGLSALIALVLHVLLQPFSPVSSA